MTVYFNQTLDIPYAGMILRRNPVNISILAGNDDIVLILYDPSGSQYDFSIAAGQKIQQLNFDLFRFEITGSGQAAIAISYPEIIEPSIEVTLNPNLPQSVSSSQLPSSLDTNGYLQINVAAKGINVEISSQTNESSSPPDITVPSGYQWRILSAIIDFYDASAATEAVLYIIRQNSTNSLAMSEALCITPSSTIASGTGNCTGIVNPSSVESSNTQTTWKQYPILYGGDVIKASFTGIDITGAKWTWYITAEQVLLG